MGDKMNYSETPWGLVPAQAPQEKATDILKIIEQNKLAASSLLYTGGGTVHRALKTRNYIVHTGQHYSVCVERKSDGATACKFS